MQLTPHFHLSEFTRSSTARRLGDANQPNAQELANLQRLAECLERIRAHLGNHPIIITSGFRNERVNRSVGGVPNSAHRLGLAADFTVPGFHQGPGSVLATCQAIAEVPGLCFDQLINEHDRWIHLGLRPADDRRQLLTIDNRGTRSGLLRAQA